VHDPRGARRVGVLAVWQAARLGRLMPSAQARHVDANTIRLLLQVRAQAEKSSV
jgi:hypothetical protein